MSSVSLETASISLKINGKKILNINDLLPSELSGKNIDEELYLGHAISMITRRNLFKETLCQISNFNANRPIELRKLNKLISIHKRQIMRLEMKSQSRLENYKFLTHIQRTLGSVSSI